MFYICGVTFSLQNLQKLLNTQSVTSNSYQHELIEISKNHESLKHVQIVMPIQTLKLIQIQIIEGMRSCYCSRRTLPIRNTLMCAVIGLAKATALCLGFATWKLNNSHALDDPSTALCKLFKDATRCHLSYNVVSIIKLTEFSLLPKKKREFASGNIGRALDVSHTIKQTQVEEPRNLCLVNGACA